MNRPTVILLIVLVVLGLVAFLIMQKPGERSVIASEGEYFVEMDSIAVDRIEIGSPAFSVILEKRGGEWFVERPVEYRADQEKVRTLIKNAKNLRVGAIVSRNPEKQSLFQVDSSGTVIRISEKGSVRHSFIVGKMGPGFSDVYVRKENSSDVFAVDAAISYDTRRSPKDWRDHAVITVPKESIAEVTFQYGDTTFALALKDSAWMIGKDVGNNQSINSVLTALSSLQCDNFLDAPPSPASKLVATISFNNIQIRFSQPRGGDSYYAQTSTGPQWYELRSWRVDQILKRKKELLAP
ncbi:MAG: DUF4340 domain-containing protein [Ignavibacteriales bacterium]|nr:DUF4340 domain-containing protein [Ignavibacteriales bacterium]